MMVNMLKESIEESMFSQGKGEEEVTEWALNVKNHSRDKQPRHSCQRSSNIARRRAETGV